MKFTIAITAIFVIWLTSVYPSWTFKIASDQSYAEEATTVDATQDSLLNFSNDIEALATKATLDAHQNAEALELLFKKIEKLENSNKDLKEKLDEIKSKTQNELGLIVKKPTEVKLQKVAPVRIEGYKDQHYFEQSPISHDVQNYYSPRPHYYGPNAAPKIGFWEWICFAAKSLVVWGKKLLGF